MINDPWAFTRARALFPLTYQIVRKNNAFRPLSFLARYVLTKIVNPRILKLFLLFLENRTFL